MNPYDKDKALAFGVDEMQRQPTNTKKQGT